MSEKATSSAARAGRLANGARQASLSIDRRDRTDRLPCKRGAALRSLIMDHLFANAPETRPVPRIVDFCTGKHGQDDKLSASRRESSSGGRRVLLVGGQRRHQGVNT